MKIHNGGVVSIPDGIALGVGLNATTSNVLNDYDFRCQFTPTLASEGGNLQESIFSRLWWYENRSQYTVGSYNQSQGGNIVHFQTIDVDSYSGGQSSNNSLNNRLPFASFNYVTWCCIWWCSNL